MNARLVRQVIREVREAGATIFLTTHDVVTADELCDRVAFLVEGAIAALDSPRALRLAHGRRRVRLEMTRDGTRVAREFALDGLADDSMIGITPLPFSALLAISVAGALSAPLLALVLATAAPNKVAGLAVVKVLNGLNLMPIAAFFLPTPLQYVAGMIPTYWPMRAFWSAAAGEGDLAYLVIGATSCALALILAALMFERRLVRRG